MDAPNANGEGLAGTISLCSVGASTEDAGTGAGAEGLAPKLNIAGAFAGDALCAFFSACESTRVVGNNSGTTEDEAIGSAACVPSVNLDFAVLLKSNFGSAAVFDAAAAGTGNAATFVESGFAKTFKGAGGPTAGAEKLNRGGATFVASGTLLAGLRVPSGPAGEDRPDESDADVFSVAAAGAELLPASLSCARSFF